MGVRGVRMPQGVAARLGLGLLVIALVLAAYVAWPRQSVFSGAVSLLPPDTERVLWTDWEGVRMELDCSGWADCSRPLDDSDLGAASVLATSGPELEEAFGLTPAQVHWELLGQGGSGQVLILHLRSTGGLERALDEAGYTAHASDRADGPVWEGGADLTARLGIQEPAFQNAAFLDDGLALFSDDPEHLADAVHAARSGGLDFGLTTHLDRPVAAVGFVGDRACTELSFASADAGARAEAEGVVEANGGVSPLDGYLVGLGRGGTWTAVLGHESGDHARRDRDARAALAVEEDPGQGVAYRDVFTLETADADGKAVVLRGHAGDATYALTQVTQGPVLLASC